MTLIYNGMQRRVLTYDMNGKSALEPSYIYTRGHITGICAKSRELARAQVWVRFPSYGCSLVRRGLLNKLHSRCDLEYIVVCSGVESYLFP